MSDPYIEVQHPDSRNGAQAVAHVVDMDTGPLAMPAIIHIGAMTWDNKHKITCYKMQVDEYDIWLEDQIRAQNPNVLNALDDIYNKAINAGVILRTHCMPQPYITTAHVVKRVIMELAAG